MPQPYHLSILPGASSSVLARAARSGLVYLGFSVVWIVGSDALLFWLLPGEADRLAGELAKGLAFVGLSAVLVAALVRRELLRAREVETHFLRTLDLQAITERSGVVVQARGRWSEVLGIAPESLVGRPLSSLVAEESDREALRQVLEAEAGVAGRRLRLAHADGSPRWVEASGWPEDGRVYLAARDVTAEQQARARAEEAADRLLHAQRMESVGRLAGGVAHDFNNLLMIIGNAAELLADELAADSPHQEVLGEIRAAQASGAALTRQLLTFSRQAPVQPAELDLGAALQGLRPLLRRLLGVGIRLDIEVPDAPVRVRLAPIGLEQVVMNLAANARDAMPSGGRLALTLSADPDAGQAVLSVGDTGEGIPPEIAARIFEPFFTTKPPEQGTGLGLSTSYGIIAAAGGQITVASALGAGTTFTLRLPMLPASPTAPADCFPEHPNQAPHS